MVQEGIKWAHSLGYSSHFGKLHLFFFSFFGARQSPLCCQAAECFVESWAALKGYIRARSQIDQSFQLQPKAATIIKLDLDHAVVIYKARYGEMEGSTWAGNPSLHLSFFSFVVYLTASLLSIVSLLLLKYVSADQLENTNRCRFSSLSFWLTTQRLSLKFK